MTYLINSTMKIAIVAIGIVTCGIMASAQSREINGKVTDDSGESLPGVYVIEKGNDKNGTVTDNDGLFTLELKDSASVLVFSFLGISNFLFLRPLPCQKEKNSRPMASSS